MFKKQIKSISKCKWDWEIIERQGKHHWVIWTYDNCGLLDSRMMSNAGVSDRINAHHRLKEFCVLNNIGHLEKYKKNFKEVPLEDDNKLYAIVNFNDYEKVRKYRWYKQKGVKINYAIGYVEGSNITMHRFILELNKGDSNTITHKDKNGLNNSRNNLKVVSGGNIIRRRPR